MLEEREEEDRLVKKRVESMEIHIGRQEKGLDDRDR